MLLSIQEPASGSFSSFIAVSYCWHYAEHWPLAPGWDISQPMVDAVVVKIAYIMASRRPCILGAPTCVRRRSDVMHRILSSRSTPRKAANNLRPPGATHLATATLPAKFRSTQHR
ncbi:hypothetical protein B0T19DRAFT_467333 [Cercophora scortea]|uniref:Uncharacterized protein n=1 Tax=Cercophora scortea TaxID=314031 RepID=A0AAE0M514_9PEZI|nr:hypothetical protein B0T19DRAFT_467333 [Cercophora scortea]